jgi:hypothetical protein
MRMPADPARAACGAAPQQRLERPGGQRRGGLLALVALEGVEPVALEDALGLVGEQHRVAVEGDAHLVGVRVGRPRRLRVDARGRHAGASAERTSAVRWSTGTGWPPAAAGSATAIRRA